MIFKLTPLVTNFSVLSLKCFCYKIINSHPLRGDIYGLASCYLQSLVTSKFCLDILPISAHVIWIRCDYEKINGKFHQKWFYFWKILISEIGDVFCTIGVRELQKTASEAFCQFGEYHRQMEKYGIKMLKATKPVESKKCSKFVLSNRISNYFKIIFSKSKQGADRLWLIRKCFCSGLGYVD